MVKNGGARRNRTADLLHAMQALSQLSYGPLPFHLTHHHLISGPCLALWERKPEEV